MGDESEYGFLLNYDSTKLSNPVVGAGNAGASVRSCNVAVLGGINCSIGGFPNNNPNSTDPGIGEINPGNDQILITVTFNVNANAGSGASPLTLTNVNASNDNADLVAITSVNGSVNILGPTSAQVSVGGRVTTADGRGIRNVAIKLTAPNGTVRFVLSSSFGYFNFENVPAGETYVINATAKQFTFSQPTRVIFVSEDIKGINFTADP
jgi:hypothetical protein